MKQESTNKNQRILNIYARLIDGYAVNKAEEAARYNVNEKSIQRDLRDICNFIEKKAVEDGCLNKMVYDRKEKGYRLERISRMKFQNSEVLAVCKILLDSRAFRKDEMVPMIDKLLDCCVPKTSHQMVKELIENEKFHYIEPKHRMKFIDKMWDLGIAIKNTQLVEIEYLRLKDKQYVKRIIKPVAIMFSEYYFYLAAFINDLEKAKQFERPNDPYPTIYRIDRIVTFKVLKEHFKIPYKDRFEEGEFRKRIQFMFGGELRKIKFKYSGQSLEAILDRLPTAKIIKEEKDGCYLEAEVFGKGIDMWLKSQSEYIQVVE
ncbi:WYL domain-containing protein [Petroclostridium sp. X23]|uniref:helix-turn-helix transcriptional regulator n=1 Tax=Petroclostridium sp. X23 TaxID=3045146 RepID=UPI0024ACA538|nr:WYL domain-containing protein [Petroclostridium sp. X23]WHH60970.1 WYL domain-containing protein [Petroclostridium sp. X23]